jgi:hypothetical protein
VVTEFNVGFDEHRVRVHHHMPDEDGVYAKEVHIPAGVELKSHAHAFTHKSILASGRAVVRAGGVEQLVVGPAVLTLKSGVEHSVQAVVDVVWFCIHATNETDPEKIDRTLVQEN